MTGASRARYAALLLGLVLLAAQTVSWAQRPSTRPDLSGFWSPANGVKPVASLMASLAPNTVVLDDAGAPELPSGDFGGLQVKPAALAEALKWKPEDDMVVEKACLPPSIIYAMQGPFPMEIHQGTEFIIIKLEYFDLVRIIFMDGRSHPPADAPHSKVGHSIGRWEGGTLIVDTTHLSAATITNNGLNHSDNVHLIERFQLQDGKVLVSTQEFEDPEVLGNRGARFIAWNRVPGQYVFPYECDPRFGAEFLEQQK